MVSPNKLNATECDEASLPLISRLEMFLLTQPSGEELEAKIEELRSLYAGDQQEEFQQDMRFSILMHSLFPLVPLQISPADLGAMKDRTWAALRTRLKQAGLLNK